MSEPTGQGHELTRLLARVGRGEDEAVEELLPVVYGELRRLASGQIRRSGREPTLNTTALVHEAFLRLSGGMEIAWNDRCHFYAVAAKVMRRVLVDHARSRGAQKRGGGWKQVDLDSAQLSVDDQAELVLDIETALERLSGLDPRLTQVVECRFFAGMQVDETARALGVSEKTVRRDWIKARAWLHRELAVEPGS